VGNALARLACPQVKLERTLVTANPLRNKQASVRVIAQKDSHTS
jgi:hypothetical protein